MVAENAVGLLSLLLGSNDERSRVRELTALETVGRRLRWTSRTG